jgi:hypothetical protein
MKRKKINQTKAKKLFTATASKTHKKNLQVKPMRGGFRI